MSIRKSGVIRHSDFLTWGIIIIFFIFIVSDSIKIFSTDGYILFDLIKKGIGGIITMFFVLIMIRDRNLFMPIPIFSLIALFLVAVLSSFKNIDRSGLAALQFFFTFGFFIQVLLFSNISFTARHLILISNIFVWISFPVAAYGILEVALDFPSLSSLAGGIADDAVLRGDLKSATSIFLHPGSFAWLISSSACICFCRWIVGNEKLSGIIFAVFVAALIVAMRKKTLIALFIGILVILWMIRQSIANWMKSLFLMTGLGVCIFLIFPAYFLTMLNSLRFEEVLLGEFTPRLKLAVASLTLAVENFPLGTGLSTFGSATSVDVYSPLYGELGLSNHYGMTSSDPRFLMDTFWPMLLAEIGFLGVLFYLSCLIGIGRRLFIFANSCKSKDLKVIAFLAVMLFCKSFVESVSTPIFSKLTYSIFIAFYCGGALSIIRMQSAR